MDDDAGQFRLTKVLVFSRRWPLLSAPVTAAGFVADGRQRIILARHALMTYTKRLQNRWALITHIGRLLVFFHYSKGTSGRSNGRLCDDFTFSALRFRPRLYAMSGMADAAELRRDGCAHAPPR